MPIYLTFRVDLVAIHTAPWRVFEIRLTTFTALHGAIQDACGWMFCHLFQFVDNEGALCAGLPDKDSVMNRTPDAAMIKLESFFTEVGAQCTYVYDFGDGWEHCVRLLEIREDGKRYQRRLIAGALSSRLRTAAAFLATRSALLSAKENT